MPSESEWGRRGAKWRADCRGGGLDNTGGGGGGLFTEKSKHMLHLITGKPPGGRAPLSPGVKRNAPNTAQGRVRIPSIELQWVGTPPSRPQAWDSRLVEVGNFSTERYLNT